MNDEKEADKEIEQPGYYAVIPATVRYNENLTPHAKLLYGKITALCNKYGYCFANNKYFTDLYKVTIRSVSNWLAELEREEFILVEIDKKKGNKRKIYLTHPIEKIFYTYRKKSPEVVKNSSIPLDKEIAKKPNKFSNIEAKINREIAPNITYNNTINKRSPFPLSLSPERQIVRNNRRSPKGRKGKGNVDKNLFERLRSGIYRNDLFTMYDNLLRIRSIEELAGDAAYKAIKSVLRNNEEFLRQEYGTNYSKFPKDETSEVIAKRFPYDKLPDNSDEDARRNFFVSAVCNTVAEVMTEALGRMREVETANKKPRINHRR